MTKKQSFTFHASWISILCGLPEASRLEVYDALSAYALTDTIPQMSELAAQVFETLKIRIDLDREREAIAVAKGKAWSAQANAKRWAKHRREAARKASEAANEACEAANKAAPDRTKTLLLGENRMESQNPTSEHVDENAQNRGEISVSPNRTKTLLLGENPKNGQKSTKNAQNSHARALTLLLTEGEAQGKAQLKDIIISSKKESVEKESFPKRPSQTVEAGAAGPTAQTAEPTRPTAGQGEQALGQSKPNGQTAEAETAGQASRPTRPTRHTDKPTPAERAEQARRRLRQRQGELAESLRPYVGQYGRDMIRRFFDYWSEPNRTLSSMRCDLQPTWDLARRLAYWARRDDTFAPTARQPTDDAELRRIAKERERLDEEREARRQEDKKNAVSYDEWRRMRQQQKPA